MLNANARRQHQDSNVFMPRPGHRRRSTHAPAQPRTVTRPIAPGRTTSGNAQQIQQAQQAIAANSDNSIYHNTLIGRGPSAQWPIPSGPAPPAKMVATPAATPAVPDVAAAEPDEIERDLSQKLNELPSNLTSGRASESEPSSPEAGEIVEPSSSPGEDDEVVAARRPPAQSTPAARPTFDWVPQRASAAKARESIRRQEELKNVPLSSQGELEYFQKAQAKEARRDQQDSLFVRGDTEDRMSDHGINEDEVVPESMPPQPVEENIVVTNNRKRPSPEPEVSDNAKRQKSSNFRTRSYDKLSPEGKAQRDSLLATIKKNWGLRCENAISQELWLIDSRTKKPSHPKNWSTTVLETIIQLSVLTPKDPARASIAMKEAISRRTALGQGSRRLERVEDIDIAKTIVMTMGPQAGRAQPASPPAGHATLSDVLRQSTSSTATLDHETPSRRPATRRDSGSGGNQQLNSPTLGGATPPIKYELSSQQAPLPLSPRTQPRKLYTLTAIVTLPDDALLQAHRRFVTQCSQVEREMARRRPGGENLISLNRELSKLNSESLFQMYQESLKQEALLGQEVRVRMTEVPGESAGMPMCVDE